MREFLKIIIRFLIAAAGLAILVPLLVVGLFVIAAWADADSPKPTTGELPKEEVTAIMDSYSELEAGEYGLLYSVRRFSIGIPTRIDNDFILCFEDDKIGCQIQNTPEWQPLTESIDEAYPLCYIIQGASESGHYVSDISDKILCYHRWTDENGSDIYLFYDRDNRIIYGRYHKD